jgi:hypothetical protein
MGLDRRRFDGKWFGSMRLSPDGQNRGAAAAARKDAGRFIGRWGERGRENAGAAMTHDANQNDEPMTKAE